MGESLGDSRAASRRDGANEILSKRLEAKLDPASLGFEFLPVKRLGLEAASGTTPFSLLFLGFSFFIIAAAVMLVALLFKLGIDGRAAEIGTLLAIGFRRRKIRRLLLGEGAIVAIVGGVIGVAAGLGYAWLMLEGLRTWWLAAVVTPFLQLYVTGESLLVGFAVGVLVSLATIVWSLRQQSRGSVRQLLSGTSIEPFQLGRHRAKWPRVAGFIALISAVAVAASLGGRMSGEEQAGVFFTSGFLVLLGLLLLLWDQLRSDRGARTAGRENMLHLAMRNGARRPTRSTLTIGLTAAASFIIVAVSAFWLAPPSEQASLHSGDGGFSLYAETDQPIYQDLNSPDGRKELPFETDADKLLADVEIIGLRGQAGDDASCLNLYQPRQPRILGVPPALVKHDGFEWSATAAETQAERDNPWLLLNATSKGTAAAAAIPVVLDANTATYSLHLDGVGAIYNITDSRGQRVPLRVVGLLQNSLFQGDLLMRESELVRLFPETSGYRVFLIDTRRGLSPFLRAPAEGRSAEKKETVPLARSPGCASSRQRLGRLRLRRRAESAAARIVHGGAKHLSFDISTARRIGSVARHNWPGGRAVAERARAPRGTGPDAGSRFPPPPARRNGAPGKRRPAHRRPGDRRHRGSRGDHAAAFQRSRNDALAFARGHFGNRAGVRFDGWTARRSRDSTYPDHPGTAR